MSVDAAGPLVVTYPLSERSRAIVAEELAGAAAAVYLADLAPPERAAALRFGHRDVALAGGAVYGADLATKARAYIAYDYPPRDRVEER
jgi:hypothetical protein